MKAVAVAPAVAPAVALAVVIAVVIAVVPAVVFAVAFAVVFVQPCGRSKVLGQPIVGLVTRAWDSDRAYIFVTDEEMLRAASFFTGTLYCLNSSAYWKNPGIQVSDQRAVLLTHSRFKFSRLHIVDYMDR